MSEFIILVIGYAVLFIVEQMTTTSVTMLGIIAVAALGMMALGILESERQDD